MKITAAAAPLAILRSILLQQAALKQPEKSRSYTAKGPGIMPHRKTQGNKFIVLHGRKRIAIVPRLMRASGPGSLDHDTKLRKIRWQINHRTD
jgi:hypothetical protein